MVLCIQDAPRHEKDTKKIKCYHWDTGKRWESVAHRNGWSTCTHRRGTHGTGSFGELEGQ